MAFGSSVLFSCVAGAFAASASFFPVRSPALDSISKAWKMWHDVPPGGNEPEWPRIEMDIAEPKLGVTIAPQGMHPKAYLQFLPELRDYSITDAEIAYTSNCGDEVTITSYRDWLSFFHQLDRGDAHTPRLRLKFKSLKQKEAEEKLRKFCELLMLGGDVPTEEDLEREKQFLREQGLSRLESKHEVHVELGPAEEDWPGLIDGLAESWVPLVWGETLKRAARAKRGAVESLATTSHLNGVRRMTYTKFGFLPAGEGGVDGLVAVSTLEAKASAETAGMRVEQSFNRYVELNAHAAWWKMGVCL